MEHINNKPFVITVYDCIHEKYPEIANSIDKTLENKKILIANANMILAISGNTKNDLIQLYNVSPEKIEVVYLLLVNKQWLYQ